MKHHLQMILLFTRQELFEQYRGNALGIVWLFIQPLTYILIFTLIFSDIMKTRLANFDQPYAYSTYLVAGILSWNMIINIITKTSSVYQTKAGLIKKVPTHLLMLPIYIPLAEAIIYVIGMVLFSIVLLLVGHDFSLGWLWLPPLTLCAILFAYTTGILFGLLSPFIPDIRSAIPIFSQLLFWMTPIIYLPDIVPKQFQWLLDANPFTWLIRNFQAIIFYQTPLDWGTLAAALGLTTILSLLVYWLHLRLEKDIRDLI
jgi:lipopolysaccharide transport system permease protein